MVPFRRQIPVNWQRPSWSCLLYTSTLTVLLGGSTNALSTLFTPLTAIVFLVFTLLYTPCVAAISSVRRELGGKWALGVVIMQCVIAWIAAWIVRMIGLILGLG